MNNQTLHPLLEQFFRKIGLLSQDNPKLLNTYLSNNLRELPDLTALLDLEKAAERIISAMDQGEVIGIYGDYDVDGTTSCALLKLFFDGLGIPNNQIKTYQPDRFIDGYGLHVSSIKQAIKDGTNVLITVDCGITSYDACEFATSESKDQSKDSQHPIDVIITDHHQDNKDNPFPPAFAIVNPNRRDETCKQELRGLSWSRCGLCFGLENKKSSRSERAED